MSKKPKTYSPQGPKSAFNQGSGWTIGPQKGTPASQVYGNSQTASGVQAPVGGPPVDPQYEAYALSANRNVALGNANAAYQQGQTDQTFGYGASGAANPYSRAALLQESFRRSQAGTQNSYAGAGQLYSGAYRRMQGENQRQYSIGEDANRRLYDQTSYGIRYGQAQTAANNGVGLDDQDYQRLLRALGVA